VQQLQQHRVAWSALGRTADAAAPYSHRPRPAADRCKHSILISTIYNLVDNVHMRRWSQLCVLFRLRSGADAASCHAHAESCV